MEAPAEEFRGYDVISAAMSSDIPKDQFDRFATSRYGNSQVFSGHYDDSVANEDLEALIPRSARTLRPVTGALRRADPARGQLITRSPTGARYAPNSSTPARVPTGLLSGRYAWVGTEHLAGYERRLLRDQSGPGA